MSSAPDDDRRIVARYLREIGEYPVLSHDDERQLLRRTAEGDPEATSRLVESNLGFVVKIAAEYRSLGVPFEDLLNEGNLGLIEAAKRFDIERETKFITYAVWWIRKTILRAIADRSIVVRVPSYRRKKVYELKKAELELTHRLERRPTREELADHLSTNVTQVDSLRRLLLAPVSLDRSVGEDEATPLIELLEDTVSSIEDRLLDEEIRELIVGSFRVLSAREQAVLGWRFALCGHEALTLQQIGRRIGVSRERVRQIEDQAKRRLRRSLVAKLRSRSRRRPGPP
jgi:RNA polymerase primary sigma factor